MENRPSRVFQLTLWVISRGDILSATSMSLIQLVGGDILAIVGYVDYHYAS